MTANEGIQGCRSTSLHGILLVIKSKLRNKTICTAKMDQGVLVESFEIFFRSLKCSVTRFLSGSF